MPIVNLLPATGHNAERRESDVVELRRTVCAADLGSAKKAKKLRRLAVPLALVVGIGGIGGVATAAILNSGHIEHVGPTKSFPVSTHLGLTVVPDHGPIGSVVTVKVTGCFDPDGQNHAISFNSTNGRANDPAGLAAIHSIAVTQDGSTLNGQFRVPDDATASATFFAQCGASSEQIPFHTTSSHE